MAVTPNYSWPVPVATDFVKDGWEAISDLGNAIDTTVGGLGVAGLTLITSQSFTTSGAVNVNNCFSSTYTNYKIIATGLPSITGIDFNLRLRVGGVDNSTASSYVSQRLTVNSTTVAGARATATQATIGIFDTTLVNAISMDIFNPFLASATGFFSNNLRTSGSGAIENYAGTHNQTVSYDGFSFIPSSGTITGTLKVYGYKD